MTFTEWLNEYFPDWESEYTGTIRVLEDAWNAALDAATKTDDIQSLKSHRPELEEFRRINAGGE
jgi:hypothetical protein